MNALSIIIPTLNEEENIEKLVCRIDDSMKQQKIKYEIIFIDDHSTDKTISKILHMEKLLPISTHKKRGERGKSRSIIEGISRAKYDLICMIDADLQYPPEAISKMHAMLIDNDLDVVLTERIMQENSKLRQFTSKIYNLLFVKLLFGIDYDTQSGLKLFKKSALKNEKLDTSPWTFDLEFIIKVLLNGSKISSYPIVFAARNGGETKVRVLKVTIELAMSSIMLHFKNSRRKIKSAYRRNVILRA